MASAVVAEDQLTLVVTLYKFTTTRPSRGCRRTTDALTPLFRRGQS
jgi:hypothetical protein